MKIPNDMFDGNNKKVVSPSPPNRNSNEDVNLERDTIPKQNIFGMEKWKKIVVIVIAVIVFVVGVVGVVAIKSFISPSGSDAPKTTVSSSSKKSTTETNKNAIKDFAKESDSSSPSSTKESSVSSSKKSDSSSPSSTKESSVSPSKNNTSSENPSDSSNDSGDSDVSNIQQRIQSSLPDLTIGDTQLHTNTDVVVRSTKTTNGVESILTANDKPFAIITTKDDTDSLKLLAGYQAFASELKTQK